MTEQTKDQITEDVIKEWVGTEAEIRLQDPDRPRMYDVTIENFRFVTQDDVDLMLLRLAEKAFEPVGRS